MKTIFIFFFLLNSFILSAQNYSESYPSLIGKAEELYQKKDYAGCRTLFAQLATTNNETIYADRALFMADA